MKLPRQAQNSAMQCHVANTFVIQSIFAKWQCFTTEICHVSWAVDFLPKVHKIGHSLGKLFHEPIWISGSSSWMQNCVIRALSGLFFGQIQWQVLLMTNKFLLRMPSKKQQKGQLMWVLFTVTDSCWSSCKFVTWLFQKMAETATNMKKQHCRNGCWHHTKSQTVSCCDLDCGCDVTWLVVRALCVCWWGKCLRHECPIERHQQI